MKKNVLVMDSHGGFQVSVIYSNYEIDSWIPIYNLGLLNK